MSFPTFTEMLKTKLYIIHHSKGVIIIFLWKIQKHMYLQKWDKSSFLCTGRADCTLYQHTTIATEFLISSQSTCQKELVVYIICKYKQPSNITNITSLRKYLLFVKVISEDWKLARGIHAWSSTAVNHSESADVIVLLPKIA